MYWLPPFRTQRDPRKVVTHFLRKLQADAAREGRSVGVQEGDVTATGWKFFRANYAHQDGHSNAAMPNRYG